MKRVMKMIVSAALFSLLLGATALASSNYTEGYFAYQIEDDSVTICGYFGKESEVTVPAMIVGNPVSKIAKGAFADNTTVQKVNLPDTIMTIEEGAFASGISVVYNSNTGEPVTSGGEESGNPGNGQDVRPGTQEPEREISGADTSTNVPGGGQSAENSQTAEPENGQASAPADGQASAPADGLDSQPGIESAEAEFLTDGTEGQDSDLSGGQTGTAGIGHWIMAVIGAIVLIAVVVMGVFFYFRERKKTK